MSRPVGWTGARCGKAPSREAPPVTEALTVPSPVGPLTLTSNGEAIVGVAFRDEGTTGGNSLLRAAAAQLDAYFAGARDDFDLPFAPAGSPFQKRVCQAMSAIPRGQTRTYGQLADDLDSAARAVGRACGANPIPVLIPCHRVLAANGGLGGYSGAGGLKTKVFLLKLEGALGLDV